MASRDLAGVTVLDSVTLTTSDLAAMLRFYDAVLAALGAVRLIELVDEEEEDSDVEAVAWGAVNDVPVLWLVTGPHDTRGAHLRLRAETRDEVEAFYRAGVTTGGSGHAAPRRWTPYRRGEFTTTLRDPAGNLVEAVCPE